MNDFCEFCEGTGMATPDCPECNGYGWVDDPSDGGTMTCPACLGELCLECNGDGY